jgi:hypothetical protein
MSRILFPALLVGTPVLADPGLHHHPHGIELGWVAVAVISGGVGFALARLWRRK